MFLPTILLVLFIIYTTRNREPRPSIRPPRVSIHCPAGGEVCYLMSDTAFTPETEAVSRELRHTGCTAYESIPKNSKSPFAVDKSDNKFDNKKTKPQYVAPEKPLPDPDTKTRKSPFGQLADANRDPSPHTLTNFKFRVPNKSLDIVVPSGNVAMDVIAHTAVVTMPVSAAHTNLEAGTVTLTMPVINPISAEAIQIVVRASDIQSTTATTVALSVPVTSISPFKSGNVRVSVPHESFGEPMDEPNYCVFFDDPDL